MTPDQHPVIINLAVNQDSMVNSSFPEYLDLLETFENLPPINDNSAEKNNVVDESTACNDIDTQREVILKRKLSVLDKKLGTARSKLKILHQKCRRSEKKITSLESVISNLINKKLVTLEIAPLMESSGSTSTDLPDRKSVV